MPPRLPDAVAASLLAILCAVVRPAETVAQARDDRAPSFSRVIDSEVEAMLSAGTRPADDARVVVQTVLRGTTQDFNKVYRLPRTIALEGRSCRQANAFYTSSPHPRVVVCYELAQAIDRALRTAHPGASSDTVARILQFVVMHEVGHALGDVLELPRLGSSEDAADQFAIWHLLDVDGHSEELKRGTIGAVSSSLLESSGAERDSTQRAIEARDLAIKRAGNFACWYQGYVALAPGESVPGELRQVLPVARARGCDREFATLRSSWRQLLSLYVRHPLPTQ